MMDNKKLITSLMQFCGFLYLAGIVLMVLGIFKIGSNDKTFPNKTSLEKKELIANDHKTAKNEFIAGGTLLGVAIIITILYNTVLKKYR